MTVGVGVLLPTCEAVMSGRPETGPILVRPEHSYLDALVPENPHKTIPLGLPSSGVAKMRLKLIGQHPCAREYVRGQKRLGSPEQGTYI